MEVAFHNLKEFPLTHQCPRYSYHCCVIGRALVECAKTNPHGWRIHWQVPWHGRANKYMRTAERTTKSLSAEIILKLTFCQQRRRAFAGVPVLRVRRPDVTFCIVGYRIHWKATASPVRITSFDFFLTNQVHVKLEDMIKRVISKSRAWNWNDVLNYSLVEMDRFAVSFRGIAITHFPPCYHKSNGGLYVSQVVNTAFLDT